MDEAAHRRHAAGLLRPKSLRGASTDVSKRKGPNAEAGVHRGRGRAPDPCPKIAEPTLRQIDEYHALYLSSLKELYDTHRRLFHKLKRAGSHDDLHARMSKMKEMKFS